MNLELLHQRFAEIALSGLNLQQGQSLAIKMKPEQIEIAAAVAGEAYRRGARYVDIWPEPERFLRSRLDHSRDEFLDYIPGYRALRNAELIRDSWALLSLKSPVNPAVLDGVDAVKAGRVNRAVTTADAPLRHALGADTTQWLVMAPPAPAWAQRVVGMEDPREALRMMWEKMIPILRLDHPDPPAFWHTHGKVLQARAAGLTEMGIRTLHFRDEGTDLTVPLHERAVWHGGGSVTTGGVRFAPNIPTEEVYTAPYAPGVTGRVAVTRPVRVLGGLVQGAWFRFRDGSVDEYGAETGRDLLEAFLTVDRGSSFMGEVALVDMASPIYASGLVFENILLDENAACHFALGAAYPTTLSGGVDMTDDQLDAVGANRSRQHLDFMIGSEDTEVSGTCVDGSSVEIIRDGRFVL
jgi:aminopeptidase